MRTARAGLVTMLLALTACSTSTGPGRSASPDAPASSVPVATTACPTDKHAVETLLGAPVPHVEGATSGTAEQICAFSTSSTDVGALSVVYLRFPRPELSVTSLAAARRVYGSALTGHTVTSVPSWGTDAFLDESTLPHENAVADFAWVPGFEIILGMHADDRHVADRRQLIDRLVAFTR